jgi:REP element-mobilizing transposase RayT
MKTAWFLTSTFYGNWLPGDERGFVGRVWEKRDEDSADDVRHVHNVPKTECDADIEGLRIASEGLMRGPAVRINAEQAQALLVQFQETARYRDWQLLAVAILANHVHLVVEADEAVDPIKILGDFEAYGSRALNRRWGKPKSGTWWTSKGSNRKLKDDAALRGGIRYALRQEYPLLIWCRPEYEHLSYE